MDDSITVQVLNRKAYLIRKLFDSLFLNFKLSELNVVEQVSALHEL